MAEKKWTVKFFLTLFVLLLLFMIFNAATDPFGAFGDRFFNWFEYDMTMNPRVAKISYLEAHHQEYDSYIIGSSKASSLPVEELNEYTGGKFYNMTWYGGDIKDEMDLVNYILSHYSVKNIVLSIDPQIAEFYDREDDPLKDNMHFKTDKSSPLKFYSKYLFCNPQYGINKIRAYRQRGYLMTSDTVYTAETGCYNKQIRDVKSIGELSDYLKRENNLIEQEPSDLPYIEDAIYAISEIKKQCLEHDVNLTVIGVPVYKDDFNRYNVDRLKELWKEIAKITSFYDFWGNNNIVNNDIRYFYDSNHFRNCAGSMVLAYIYRNQNQYIPGNFGHYTTNDNVEERINSVFNSQYNLDESSYIKRIPILMYHSFTADSNQISETNMDINRFEEQMSALYEEGYTSILYDDLIKYVMEGKELPEKAIVISMDDGYENNISLAAPVLQQYGFKTSIAVIGCSIGKDSYKDTGKSMLPHFSLEEAEPYVRNGMIEIQSHTYDMHQVKELDGENCRHGVLKMENESDYEYVKKLKDDFNKSRNQIINTLHVPVDTVTYPYGAWDELSEVVLHSLGVNVSVTINEGMNTIIKGIPQSLYQLKRINCNGDMAASDLIKAIQNY